MIEQEFNNILNEFTNMKKHKDKIIKEEEELIKNFKDFSKNFDILYDEFSNYISIKNIDIINDDIKNNIKIFRTKIINQIENHKNFKNTKIFELSKLFDKNINFDEINNLIDDLLEVNIHLSEVDINTSGYKSSSKEYSNFYDDLSNSDNYILANEKKSINLNNKIINKALKCYGCDNESTRKCISKDCCNFLLCNNCIETCNESSHNINHNLEKIEGEKNEDKERKNEELISEIYKFYSVKINFLFEKEIFPIFPDKKEKRWQYKYLDEIEQLFKKTSVKVNNNISNNLNEFKICKRIIKKLLDKINFKLPIFLFDRYRKNL